MANLFGRNTQNYVLLLGTLLLTSATRPAQLDARQVELIARSAPLHDIGKVGIPDGILLKPGPLTDQEWEIMRTHPELGAQAIEQAEGDVDAPVEFLDHAKEIARSHHERWDGKGYPRRLQGEGIPLSARLMALADVFDALISARPYKPPHAPETAREIIAQECGKHFDPVLCALFIDAFDQFVAIAERYQD